jgi:hypothetical protein
MTGTRLPFPASASRPRIAASNFIRALLAMVAIAAASTGCRQAQDANAPEQAAAVNSDTAAAATEAFAIVAEFSAKDTVAAEKDSRILRWAESGCGMSPVVKTSSMLLNDAVLQPDFIVEFAADGRVLRTWGKPYNAQIGVLRGDRISFAQTDQGQERMYWTDTAGRIAPGDDAASARPRIDESAPVDCPSLELFGDSEYLQCFETLDTTSGKPHRLALEAACT